MTVVDLHPKKPCRWCGDDHPDEHCPRVSAFQFYKGEMIRVEFFGDPVVEFEFDDDDPEAS